MTKKKTPPIAKLATRKAPANTATPKKVQVKVKADSTPPKAKLKPKSKVVTKTVTEIKDKPYKPEIAPRHRRRTIVEPSKAAEFIQGVRDRQAERDRDPGEPFDMSAVEQHAPDWVIERERQQADVNQKTPHFFGPDHYDNQQPLEYRQSNVYKWAYGCLVAIIVVCVVAIALMVIR